MCILKHVHPGSSPCVLAFPPAQKKRDDQTAARSSLLLWTAAAAAGALGSQQRGEGVINVGVAFLDEDKAAARGQGRRHAGAAFCFQEGRSGGREA
jgi:hypothetical protein